jgi:hypothetical protein
MLSKVVTEYLDERLPGQFEKIAPQEGFAPFIRFKPKWPDFGDIDLHDDVEEVTIVFGRFTHSHYGNYQDISREEKELHIAENVFAVLKATFDDELEFFGSHEGSGGFQGVDYVEEQDRGMLSRIFGRRNSETFYRWSGATRKTKS